MQTNEFIYENKRGTGPPGLWGHSASGREWLLSFARLSPGRKDGHRASGRRRGAVRKKEKKPLRLRRGLLWNGKSNIINKIKMERKSV